MIAGIASEMQILSKFGRLCGIYGESSYSEITPFSDLFRSTDDRLLGPLTVQQSMPTSSGYSPAMMAMPA